MKKKDGTPTSIENGSLRKKINKRQFEELCRIQCTQEEICAVLDVDDKTLTKWCKFTYNLSFSEIFAKKRKGGKASLRRTQWLIAYGGNASMAIWLGKQYLGQTDKVDQSLAVKSIEVVNDIPTEETDE